MGSVIWFLIVLSVLVMAHELGHFAVGRWVGARIEEFAIGFPPRIWSVRRGQTDYSINAVPLGGYVRFAGEENPDVPGGLASLPRFSRALVLVAGVTMNVVLAVVLFTIVFATGLPAPVPSDLVKVGVVVAGSPAEQAGMKAGDIVLKINDQVIDKTETLSNLVRTLAGQEIGVVVRRESGQEETLRMTPRADPPAGQGPLGIQLVTYEMRSYGLPEAFLRGLGETGRAVYETFALPVRVIRGLIPAEQARPVGPLGIGRIVGGAADQIPTRGFSPIILITAYLSVSLAVVNILPLPGFDGGRLVFVILEWLRGGRRVDPRREAIIHFAGLMLLMGLVVVITYFDIVNPMPSIWGP